MLIHKSKDFGFRRCLPKYLSVSISVTTYMYMDGWIYLSVAEAETDKRMGSWVDGMNGCGTE